VKHLSGRFNRVLLLVSGFGLRIWDFSIVLTRVTSAIATTAIGSGNIIIIASPLEGKAQKLGARDTKEPVTTKSPLVKIVSNLHHLLLKKRYIEQFV
jgi:hypothetical protein